MELKDMTMEQLSQQAATLTERIALFVQKADEVTAEYWKRMNYTHSPPPTHRADYISDKWCRVVTVEHWPDHPPRDSSVYGFICLQDGQTKALGVLMAGDIHKAASFKAPAKRARGNVFKDDFAKAITEFGIVYLK